MKCLVTGAAGFIGSHLCERLLQAGHAVTGVDAFIPYYPRPVKEANLLPLRGYKWFAFHELDLRTAELAPLAADAEVVVHLAAMPGLEKSWTEYDLYSECNLLATHRLLRALEGASNLQRVVYASTSSVYGRYASGDETLPTKPVSPYGVTKLAAELLCKAFADESRLPLVCLRFFSVYGPRQRPDMAYHKLINALLAGSPITVFGDGLQVRGNTYVGDCVAGILAALVAPAGETYNLGGGETVSVLEVIGKLERLTGRSARVRHEAARKGDQRQTFADSSKLFRHAGWKPAVGIDEGLARQVEWQAGLARRAA